MFVFLSIIGASVQTSSCAALLAHSKHNHPACARPSPHAYLISSTLSATSIHIDERKPTRHDCRCVAYRKKNHDLLCCDKEEEQNKSGEFRAAARIFPLSDDGKKKERPPQNNRNWTTVASYVDKKPDRDAMYCSWCDQGPSC